MAKIPNLLRLDLLRLGYLLERVEKQKITSQEAIELKNVLVRVQKFLPEIRRIQKEREEKIQKAIEAMKLLEGFAKKAQLPKDGEINWLKVLQLDHRGGHNIYVMSKGKNSQGKDYKPSVYYVTFGSRYGYDDSDFISELTVDLLRKIELTNEQLDEFVRRADEIVNKQEIKDHEWEDGAEKYKYRWPGAKDFELMQFQDDEDPPLSGENIDDLIKEFDVEIEIIGRSLKAYNMVVFGPHDMVSKFMEKHLSHNKNIRYGSGGSGKDLHNLLTFAGLMK